MSGGEYSDSPAKGERRLRILVLASGQGSNFQALADAEGSLGIEIVALICDREGAPCLERAERAGIPAILMAPPRGAKASREARRAYDTTLAERVAGYAPDFVLLLGWMRLLSTAFLDAFPGRVLNLHPALPGAFPGLNAVARALAASRRGDIGGTGVMLHLVKDEGVDSGPVLAMEKVSIRPGDELADLEARIHAAERRLVLDLVGRLAARVAGPLSLEPPERRSPNWLSGGD